MSSSYQAYLEETDHRSLPSICPLCMYSPPRDHPSPSSPNRREMQSQAIQAAGLVWLSGQIPADARGNLIQGSTVEKSRAIIQNAQAILQEAGSGLDRVVKVVVSSIIYEYTCKCDSVYQSVSMCWPGLLTVSCLGFRQGC